jgi:hypothetical protein
LPYPFPFRPLRLPMIMTGDGVDTVGGNTTDIMVGDTTTAKVIMVGVVTKGNGWTIIIRHRRQTTITSRRVPIINQVHSITRHKPSTTMAADVIVIIVTAKVWKNLCLGTVGNVGRNFQKWLK